MPAVLGWLELPHHKCSTKRLHTASYSAPPPYPSMPAGCPGSPTYPHAAAAQPALPLPRSGGVRALHEFCGWAPYSTRKHGTRPQRAEKKYKRSEGGNGGQMAPSEGASAGWRAGLIPRALGCRACVRVCVCAQNSAKGTSVVGWGARRRHVPCRQHQAPAPSPQPARHAA